MMDNKEKRIITVLEKEGELSTTKLRDLTKIHYDVLKIFLKTLEKQKKIKSRKSKFGTFTYWSLKK